MNPLGVPVHMLHEDLFKGLPESTIQDFAAIESRLFYPSGTALFTADETASAFFIIHRGSVGVSGLDWQEGLAGSATSPAGEVLGLSAALAGDSYRASARTLESSEIGLVDRSEFLEFLNTHSEFALRLVALLSEGLTSALDHLRALPPAVEA